MTKFLIRRTIEMGITLVLASFLLFGILNLAPGGPFDARMSKPLVRTVRGMYADGDMVVILFDIDATGRDGLPYRNAYTWYFQMKDARVVKATAFFDTRVFDEFWTRVSPKP